MANVRDLTRAYSNGLKSAWAR